MRPDPFHPYQDNPFGHQADPTLAPAKASSRCNTIVILGVVLGFGVLACAGVGTLGYFALQRQLSVSTSLPIARRADTSAQDFADFNAALAHHLSGQPAGDEQVVAWIEKSLANVQPGDDSAQVPVSLDLFMRAVECSSQTRGLSLTAKLQLTASLAAAFPDPDALGNYTVLRVGMNPEGNLATAHILFYDDDSQAFSVQWFLAKEQRDWKLYDWQRLEYGRRMSDEYASFFESNRHPDVTGYDDSLEALAEIVEHRQSAWIDQDEALRRIKLEENRAMLDSDRWVGRLRVAWTYMALDEHDECLRVLKGIPESEIPWGVWPSLALSHLVQGQPEQALLSGEKMRDIAPHHPNAHSMIAQALEQTNRREQAKSHWMTVALLCPDDTSTFWRLLSLASRDDLPQLIQIAKASKQPDDNLLRIISQGELSKQLADDWDVYFADAEVPDAVRQLARAVTVFHNGEVEEAVQMYRTLAQRQFEIAVVDAKGADAPSAEATDPFLVHAARKYLTLRIEAQQYAELLAEAASVDRILDQLIEEIHSDEYDFDGAKLVAAMDSDPRARVSPRSDVIRGYGLREQATSSHQADAELQAQAADHFRRFLDWAEQQPDEQPIGSWLGAWVTSQLVDCMLRSDQAAAAFDRWKNDEDVLEQIVSFYESNPETPGLAEVSQAALAARPPDGGTAGLRLASVVRRMADDPIGADRLLLQAILRESQATTDSEYDWTGMSRVGMRAERIVADRLQTAEIPKNHPHLQTLWRRAANAARDYRDSRAAEFILRESSKHRQLDDDVRLALHQMQATLAIEAGDLDAAFLHWEKIASLPEASPWVIRTVVDRACRDLIAAQRWDQAEALIRGAQARANDVFGDTEMVEQHALLALARNDRPGLIAALNSLSPRDAGEWLIGDAPRSYLIADPELAAELVGRYTPRQSYYVGEGESIVLIRDSQSPLDTEHVLQWADRIFGDASSTMSIGQEAEDRADKNWIVADGHGARLLVAFTTRRWDTYQGRPAVNVCLRGQASAVSVSQLDGPAIPLRTLWEFARLAIDDTTIAILCQHGSSLWPATANLYDRTEWKDRLPIGRDTLTGVYLFRGPADESPLTDEERTESDWQRVLRDGPVPVVFQLRLPGTSETLAGELQQVDVNADEAEIRLSRPSRVVPYLTAGTRIITPIHSVRLHPDP